MKFLHNSVVVHLLNLLRRITNYFILYSQYSTLNVSTILIVRGTILSLVAVLWTCLTVQNPWQVTKKNFVLILVRTVSVSTVFSVAFIVAKLLPLSTIGIIQEISPVFALILGAVVLRELPHFVEVVFGISALVGATLVIQPHFLFSISPNSGNQFSDDQYPYLLACLLLPIGMATAIVIARKLTQNQVPVPICLGTLSLMSIINGCIIRATYEEVLGFSSFKSCQLWDNVIVFVITLLNLFNQITIYYAAKFEKSMVVLVISTFKVVIYLIIDLIFFRDELHSYNYLHYAGGALVMFSIIALLLRTPCVSCSKIRSENNESNI